MSPAVADNRHHFVISATVRSAGADYSGQLAEVEIRAYSLNEALLAAAELPLSAWFPDLSCEEGCEHS